MADFTSQNIYSVPTQGGILQETTPPVAVPPPPSQKTFPKIIIYIGLGLAGLLLLAFAVKMFLPKIGGEGKEVVWWGLWEDDGIVSPLISEYEGKHPGVKVKYVRQSKEDYRERLTNALARGVGPDIFRFHNSWVPMFKKDLDPIPASVMTQGEFAKVFYPIASSDLTEGNVILGIPLEYDGLALYVNEDILATAGKSPPATWDDLRRLAIELTRKDDQGEILQAGVALGRTENVDHWPEILGLMMFQNGVDLSKPSGKLAEDALTFYTVFSSQDGVWDATLPSSTIAFAAGKVAMYFGPSWRALEIRQQNPSLKFKTTLPPQLPKSTPAERNITYASYWAEGVWTKSKNKKVAWDFLKFLSSKDSLEKLYTNASRTRLFGEPYSRSEMAPLLTSDPLVGSVIFGAADAESWYLQSRTFDGPTGINSQINKYFEDAVNAVNAGTPADKALEPVVQGVAQVLGRYGLISK